MEKTDNTGNHIAYNFLRSIKFVRLDNSIYQHGMRIEDPNVPIKFVPD